MDPVTASRLPPCRGRLKCRGNHFITEELPDPRPAFRSQGRNLRDPRRNSAPMPMSFISYILTWLSFCLQVSSLFNTQRLSTRPALFSPYTFFSPFLYFPFSFSWPGFQCLGDLASKIGDYSMPYIKKEITSLFQSFF